MWNDARTLRPKSRPFGLPFLCVFAAALAYTLDLTRRLAHFDLVFWDARVYARAIHAYNIGADPYTRSPSLNFVYSPTFLKAGSLLSHLFPGHLAWYLYLLLNGAAVFAIPIVLARGYLNARWLTPAVAVAIFFFHPLLTAQTAFTSGNICSLLYAAVLLAGIPGLRHNRWGWFYAAIACASFIKPTFLAFLLLPLLVGASQILPALLTVAAVFVDFALERRLMPAQYHAFVDSVYYQIVILGDTGFGLLSLLQPLAAHLPMLHRGSIFLVSVGLLAVVIGGLCLRRRTPTAALSGSIWIAAILVTAALANLRLLAYDADIAILPATLIVVESLRGLLERKVAPLALALPIALFTVVLAKDPRTALFLFLLASVLLVLAKVPSPQDTHAGKLDSAQV